MGDCSKHFSYHEFGCKCGKACGLADGKRTDPSLLLVLEMIRSAIGRPVTVTSGNRCPTWNKKVSGSEKSYHLEAQGCKAADLLITLSFERAIATKVALEMGATLGMNESFLHVDVREMSRIFLY